MAPITPSTAVATAGAATTFSRLLPWLALLLLLVIIGTIILTALRRSLRRPPTSASDGFSLHELRQMHADGHLSDEEFQRAKTAAVERFGSPASENRGPAAANNETDAPDDSRPHG